MTFEHPQFILPRFNSGTFARFHDERHTWPWLGGFTIDSPKKKPWQVPGGDIVSMYISVCVYVYGVHIYIYVYVT